MVETRHRTATQSGLTEWEPENRRIEIPKLVTMRALYVAWHEFGHVHCDHEHANLPLHVEEYQAEIYALGLWRVYLLPGIRSLLREAKEYVWKHIEKDMENAIEIWPEIRKWTCRNS